MDKPTNARCGDCPFKDRPIVFGWGAQPDKCSTVIVGESPGLQEVRAGRPFVGPSGELLRALLRSSEFDVPDCKTAAKETEPSGEVYLTNASLCMPPPADAASYKTTGARKQAAMCCLQRLNDELKPYAESGVVFCSVGGSSALSLVGNDEITKIRGMWHKDGRVLTTWHPAYILRQPIKVGELYTDIHKLRYGKPRWYDIRSVPKHIHVLKTEDEVERFADGLIKNCRSGLVKDSTVCLDIESDNVDWWKDKILCYGFAWDVDKAAVIPEELVYSERVRDCMIRMMEPDSGIKWVGHNFKFDMRFIRYQTGVHNIRVDYDSLLGDYVLDENRMHALKTLLTVLYDIPDYEEHLIKRYLKNRNDMYSKIPRPELYEYCAHDVMYTLMMWRDERVQLDDNGLFERPFAYPMMAAQPAYLEMELHGMLISRERMEALSQKLRTGLDELQDVMERMCGVQFNANSHKQVCDVMYAHYKMPIFPAKTKSGMSVDKEHRNLVIDSFVESGHTPDTYEPFKWITLYNEWKTLEKLRNSYVDNMIPIIDKNGRVHPDVLAYGTETGRPSVRNPALQTIPRPGSGEAMGEIWGKVIKQCFIAPPGCKLVQVDLSQAELRVAAWMSQDAFLINAYRNDIDVHGEVAEAWWPGWKDMNDTELRYIQGIGNLDKKTMRIEAKKGVFARLYLGTEHALGGILGIPARDAKPYLVKIDQLLGGLGDFEHKQFDTMKRQGYVESPLGRRRRVPLITRENTDDARKAACNAPVQGTASDIVQVALIDVHNWLKGNEHLRNVHSLITVHDSIILEVPDELVQEVATWVKNKLEEVGTRLMPGIPWKADIEVGDSWGDLKGVEYDVTTA